jgi:hypothetical protein
MFRDLQYVVVSHLHNPLQCDQRMIGVYQYDLETESRGYLEKSSGHRMTYVAFWDESMLTSISIKGLYFSIPFEPGDCPGQKICFWHIQLQEK